MRDDDSMKNLLLKLDYSYIEFLKNLPIKIGKESSTQIIKCNELHGIQLPKSLVQLNPVCDTVGNIIYKYLQRTALEDIKL